MFDISDFKTGDKIITVYSQIVYEVTAINCKHKGNKNVPFESEIQNVETGQILKVTWGNNFNFQILKSISYDNL